MNKLTFIDLFCGIGTIRMGMEQAGHKCVYSVEWDKHKRKIYSIIFGGEPEGADICTVNARELPRADVWTFGAPCQDFSIAGKRAGLEGDRSSLVSEVFRLVRETPEEYRPKYLLYENVKGMLSSNKGFDYLEILYQMDSLGYDTERDVLNSRYYEVPQNRERVFTLGHFRGCGTRKIFPLSPANLKVGVCIKRVANRKGYRKNMQVYDPSGSTEAIDTSQGGGRQPHIILPLGAIRRLTPKEFWRLQGIPDEITNKIIQAGISDSQMYRGAGDACTVNVIYEIAKKLT